MKMPAACWKMTYAAGRRKHRHRCTHCNRIVKPGEEVYMARVIAQRGRTRVLHIDCADAVVVHGATERELLECHGMQYLAALGYAQARKWLDKSPLTKTRNAYGRLA